MQDILHFLVWLGLIGLGLMVLLAGLQFATMIITAIVAAVICLWQAIINWAKKDWREDPKLK